MQKAGQLHVGRQPFSVHPQRCRHTTHQRRAECLLRRASTQPKQQGGSNSSTTSAPVAARPTGILKINPALLATGGLDLAQQPSEAKASLHNHLSSLFLPVNVDMPGMRVLNIDPPVITVSDFLSGAECDALTQAASASGLMAQSAVGGYNVQGEQAKSIRTSRTLAMTPEVLKKHAALATSLDALLNRVRQLLQCPLPTDPATMFQKPNAPGKISFELPQIAHYQPGQHFLSHEDAFPVPIARDKGYQRRATLLVYLNDVAEGGATKFDILDIAVQPKKGMALLFFPSFNTGMNDARTLHTATDAVQEKWISQLWLSAGLQLPPANVKQGVAVPAFIRGSRTTPPPKKSGNRKLPQMVNTKI